jgi:hypothetical protein
MSGKTAILTSKAPKPLPGIYSQAIVANGFVYCSGAIAMDPSGKIIEGDIAAHTVCAYSIPFSIISRLTHTSLSTNASKISPQYSRKQAPLSKKSSK